MTTFQDYLQAILGLTQAGAPRSLNPQTLGQPAVTNQPPVSDPDAAYRAAIGISPETPGVLDKEFWQPGSPTNRAFSGALANAGMNLLNGQRMSPLQAAGNLLAGTAGGYNQGIEQQEALAANRAWRQAQIGKYEADIYQQEQGRRDLEAAIAHLPPEQQAMARANPDAFLKPQDAELKPVYDPTTGGMIWANAADAAGRASDLPLAEQERLRRAGATNVSVKSGPDFQVGEVPQGQILRTDGKGSFWLEDLPGGKQAEARANAQSAAAQTSDIVTTKVDEAVKIIEDTKGSWQPAPTGVPGALTSGIPTAPANRLLATIDTIRANLGFDRLQAMRNASPTGGALGSITEMELQRLEAAVANLDPRQGEAQLKQNLEQVRKIYREIVDGPKGGGGSSQQSDPLGIR